MVMAKLKHLSSYFQQETSILPLIILRIGFGLLMFTSLMRFISRGWIADFFITPQFHFTYLGFGWIQPLPANGMYLIFGILIISTIGITLGAFYRLNILVFFSLFTYIELLDKATYLNHYYFISVLSFLMIFLPLNRLWAMDVWWNPRLRQTTVPFWMIFILRLQLGVVYFFAGFAKLNPDWMLKGVPMAIWLKANTGFPLIGRWFDYHWVALLMSWVGAFYDLTIPFWLAWRKIRPIAYLTVIVFHLMTATLFNIGIFPYVMIVMTLIFFDEQDYQRLLGRRFIQIPTSNRKSQPIKSWVLLSIIVFFAYQLLMPLRHTLYAGDTNWTMEGYNFAWRVMLNEKTAYTTFTVYNPDTEQRWIVYGNEYLTSQQMRTMTYQPDMILQFAYYLEDIYRQEENDDLTVTVEAYVAHNGNASRLIIDPSVDLTQVQRTIWSSNWILR